MRSPLRRAAAPAGLAALSLVGFVPTTIGVAFDGGEVVPSQAAQTMLTLAGVLMTLDRASRGHGVSVVLAAVFIGVTNADFHAAGSGQGSGDLVAEGAVVPPGHGGVLG